MSRVPPGGQSSQSDFTTSDRLSLHRASTETRSNPNVFSDDYAIHGTNEPSNASQNPEAVRHDAGFATSNTIPLENPFDDSLASELVYSNNHLDQSRRSVDSLETIHNPQRHDLDTSSRVPPSPSIAPSESQRSISTASRFSVPHAMSPYMGPTGPSHAYSMYPQDVGLARMNSTSTISTTRPTDRTSLRATAPQHPYLMYPQNTVPEDMLEHDNVIPVGFPGRHMVCPPAPNEVGDIVGPDGHTETLPPYSRYATADYKGQAGIDDVASHESPAAVGAEVVPPPPAHLAPIAAAAAPGSLVATNTSSTDGTITGGAASSGETLRSPLASEHVPPAGAPVALAAAAGAAGAAISAADPSGNFKEAGFRNKVKDVGRRKVCCGIPIFMLVVIAIVVVICTAIGGVIGGVLGNRKGVSSAQSAQNSTPSASTSPTSSVYVTVTTTLADFLDATPVSNVPAGLPSLVPGSYLIHINEPKQKSSCLSSDLDTAWQCREDVTVPASVGNDEYSGDSTIGFASPEISAKFNYGPQYPIFQQPEHNLTMGIELNRPDLGPGLYFETEVDKLVIIPASEFPSEDGSKRNLNYRDIARRSPDWVGQTSRVGDKPWFCWWNSTVFEVFIFLNRTASTSGTASGSDMLTATPTTMGNYMAMATPSASFWRPTTMSRRDLQVRDSDESGHNNEEHDVFSHVRRSTDYTAYFNYPVRMIERRRKDTTSSSSSPYCEQMQVLDNGKVSPIGNSLPLFDSPTPSSSSLLQRRLSNRGDSSNSDSDCYCEWFNN